ncbi:MAG: transcriptional regulator [Balneola sp.]|nr:MAG: transcriptional regulator [Balneola sp.]
MAVRRNTNTTRSLLNVIEQSNSALSVVELVNRLTKEMNKTTVYRILERLEEDGILHSFKGKDGRTWYAKYKKYSSEKGSDTHPHFQCKICGKVECLDVDVSIPSIQNRKIDSAELLLIGQCEDCLS